MLKCEVCNQEDGVGVACVPGVPYSAAYGEECLRRGADPFGIMRANVICCGGVEKIYPEYLLNMTFVDGEYMSLDEGLKRYPITEKDLDFSEYCEALEKVKDVDISADNFKESE